MATESTESTESPPNPRLMFPLPPPFLAFRIRGGGSGEPLFREGWRGSVVSVDSVAISFQDDAPKGRLCPPEAES